MIENGKEVTFRQSNVDAVIIGICVRGSGLHEIEYQIAYWHNGQRYTDWVYWHEIEVKKPKNQAGFRPPSNQLKLNNPDTNKE